MSTNTIKMVPVDDLHPHPENVRSNLGDLRTLTNSIESQGVLEPLLVRPMPSGEADTWQVIAGHRRLAAAKEAELTEVPVIVRDLTDEQAVATMLVENLQREDIDPLDEAKGYFRLVEFGWTQKKLAEEVGVSANTIRTRLRLLAIPEKWAEGHVNGEITADDVKDLVDLMDREEFDEEEALERFPSAPRPSSLERMLDDKKWARLVEEAKAELPEDEPLVEMEAKGGYGSGRSLPRNHAFLPHDDLGWQEEPIDIDIDLVREHGNLGWHVRTAGYGEDKHVAVLPVVTDRGYYTRKSSPIPDEERPESAQKMIEEREQQRQQREREKELEQVRRQRIVMTAREANKTELEEIVFDRGLNDLSSRAFRETALLFDVAHLVTEEEAKDHIRLTEGDFDPMKTEDNVQEKSLTWRISFLAAAQMFERSDDELVIPLLDKYAPFDEEEL